MNDNQGMPYSIKKTLINGFYVYMLPLLLILFSTFIKYYSFAGINYFGYRLPLILYLLSAVLSWWFGGSRAMVVAVCGAALASLLIVYRPDIIPESAPYPYSMVVFWGLAAMVMLLIVRSRLGVISLTREKDEYFRFLADSVPDKFWIGNSSGVATYYNQEWFEFTGYPTTEDLKFTIWELLHPEERDHIRELYQNKLSKGTSYAIEHRILDRNGVYRWHLSRSRPLRDAKGRIKLWVGSCTDIHERKLSEDRLRDSEQYFRTIADNAPIMIWKTDQQGNITYISKFWEHYSGLPVEEALGRKWLNALHPSDVEDLRRNFDSCLSVRSDFQGKCRLKGKDGGYHWFLATGKPLFNEMHYFAGYLGSLTDINEQEELQRKSDELLKKMDEFISIASHELKTPVTTLRGYLQLMQREANKSENSPYTDFLKRANNQQLKLSRLIQDLLDLSRIQEGKMRLTYSCFQLYGLVCDSVQALKNSYPNHSVVVTGDTDIRLVADMLKIEQVLTNLLSNAAKYSPDNQRIQIDIRIEENLVVVSVTDSGIGIASKSQSHVFDRFYRVEEVSYKFTGLGVGLYICREIVLKHHGQIWFNSTEGKGSTFCFSLPLLKDVPD